MAALAIVRVADPGSLRGIINTAAWSLDGRRAEALVQLEGVASMLMPRAALARQDDGRYHLALDFVAFDRQGVGVELNASPLVLPVIEDTLDVHTTLKEEVRLTTRGGGNPSAPAGDVAPRGSGRGAHQPRRRREQPLSIGVS